MGFVEIVKYICHIIAYIYIILARFPLSCYIILLSKFLFNNINLDYEYYHFLLYVMSIVSSVSVMFLSVLLRGACIASQATCDTSLLHIYCDRFAGTLLLPLFL